MSFQCTLSKLNLFSQLCHCRTLRNIVTLCPNPAFVDFISVFSFFCEDFDDCPTIDFCHVHDFVAVALLTSESPVQKKDCTDLFFLEYRFERISFTIISNLLRLAQNIYLVLQIYRPPLVPYYVFCQLHAISDRFSNIFPPKILPFLQLVKSKTIRIGNLKGRFLAITLPEEAFKVLHTNSHV